MPSLLPLSPGLANALPWRMNFRSRRAPATLDKFADPDFVRELNPTDFEHCEAVFTTLLTKMLKTRRFPRRVGRLRVNKEVSQKILDARGTAGMGIALGDMRFTVLESASWIGESLSRFLKAIEPDPGAAPQIPKVPYADFEYEDIGHHGAAPAAVGGPKPRKKREPKPTSSLELNPPEPAARRKRQDPSLRLRTTSGQNILGNDLRLGWLLFEVHKAVPLNHEQPVDESDAIRRLAESKMPGASKLSALLDSTLRQLELATIPDEIRSVLSAMFANAKNPEPWTKANLYWAFGVGDEVAPFDPGFWGTGTGAPGSPSAYSLRRRLLPMTELFATHSLYSPALGILRRELADIDFMGARRLQAALAPLLQGAHVIGACRFMSDVLAVRDGLLTSARASVNDMEHTDLFFWSRGAIDARTPLAVCLRARDLTIAHGAFSVAGVLEGLPDYVRDSLTELQCLEFLDEWPAVRWIEDRDYWGVVQGASPVPQLVEQMLHVTHPRPVTIENLIEALNSALQHNLDVQAARARVGGQDLVDAEVLLDALDGIGAIQRVSGSALALKGKPAKGYWAWRPIEREVIDYLHSVNGTALNRDIFRHFKGDPSVETRALSKALRVLPYLYAPSPISTALRPWAL